MADDDTDARRKRAARLREQIEQLKTTKTPPRPAGDADGKADKPGQRDRAESPRDFVHRRMREIDEEPQK